MSASTTRGVAYLDSSAFVKLVVTEPESPALLRWLATRDRLASSALLRVEVNRAVRAFGAEALERARQAMAALYLMPIDDAVLDAAAWLPGNLRSLDAIHLSTAQALGPELEAVVTYDRRMAAAAAELGVPVVGP